MDARREDQRVALILPYRGWSVLSFIFPFVRALSSLSNTKLTKESSILKPDRGILEIGSFVGNSKNCVT